MSGICAVLWKGDRPARETLAAVSAGLSLCDSERETLEADGSAGVAVSARFSTQQFHSDAHVLAACDADLYNEADLARAVGGIGEGGVAALIAAVYRKFGESFVEHLEGSFSLAIWDRKQRKLLAAVDRFGMSRLVYFEDDQCVLVGSRIDALLRSGCVPKKINPRTVPKIVNFSTNLGPETVFTAVNRLSPGHILLSRDGRTTVRKYWDMRYGVGDDSSEDRLSRRLELLVESSVAVRCKNDPFESLGAYLSGGTDSSTVVGMLSRMNRGAVKAFSIGFQEQSFNELEYADIAARKFQANHFKYLVGPEDCFQALPGMIRCYDEPFGNSSAIPTYFCARLAAQNGVKVLLAGDGGDELFGGNERYLIDKIFQIYQDVPRLLRKGVIERMLSLLPFENGLIGKARRYVRRSNLPPIERMTSFQFLRCHPLTEVFEDGFIESLDGYSVLDTPCRYYDEAPALHHLDRLLYTDVKVTLGDNDLPKVTQMSELAGIQTRFPFLATPVAEFSGCIPARLKVKGFEKRYLFKRAFRNLLPVEILRKTKHGFGIPVAPWLKSYAPLRELARDTLLSRSALERGYFRRQFIDDVFRAHESDNTSYYGDALWTLLVVELWHRQFVDQLVEGVT